MSPPPCILLTREAPDNLKLATLLRANGVVVRELPCMETRWWLPRDPPERAEIIAFASSRSVTGFFKAGLMERMCLSQAKTCFAAVGEATAQTLREHCIEPEIIADPPTGAALAEAIHRFGGDSKVLVVHGNLGKGELHRALIRLGQPVCDVTVYENIEPSLVATDPFPVAAVFVAAPSAAQRLLNHLPWLRQASFLPIGPTTESALRALGVEGFLEQTSSLCEQVNSLTRAWMSANNNTHNLEQQQ